MQGKPCTTLHARRKSSLRHCWDCPRYSPFSRGARRAGADQGCVRVADRAGGAQARSLPNFNNPARLFPGTAGPSEPTLAAVPDGALLPSVTLFALPGQAAQAAPIGTDIAPPGRRPLPGQSEQQSTNAHLVDLAAGGYRPDRRRTWDENVRTFVQTHQATCAGVRAGSCAGNCAGACTGRTRALGRPHAGVAFRY